MLLLDLPSKSYLDVTIERYSRSSPIRPMDIFDLNSGSAMSIAGLLLTYLIVLFQFKVSDNYTNVESMSKFDSTDSI